MSNANGKEETKSEAVKFTEEIQTAVKVELRMMLAAPFFAQSSRCKKFLSHIVEQTLLGNAKQLKERMIGINVFGRANDYDTGEDAIVRVTANDVRKRIGQFYQECRTAHPLQIDLPRGSYVPEFRIHVAREVSDDAETIASPSTARNYEEGKSPLPAETHTVSAAGWDHAAGSHSNSTRVKAPLLSGTRGFWLSIAFLLLILGNAAVLTEFWRGRAHTSVPDVWGAFIDAKAPVLVCLGTHNIPDADAASAGETENVTVRKETIPIDDATVITSMALLLGKKGIPFRLVAAEQTSLTDLQTQPVILIGSVDNKWTLELTQTLPFRISVHFPLGQNRPPAVSIVDAQEPGGSPWTTDFSVPLSAWKYDYAIVARENDPTIGVPVLIEAGLGNAGTLAASDMVVSGMAAELGHEPSCRGKSNFEAVIRTEMIGTKPGPSHLLRLTCW